MTLAFRGVIDLINRLLFNTDNEITVAMAAAAGLSSFYHAPLASPKSPSASPRCSV